MICSGLSKYAGCEGPFNLHRAHPYTESLAGIQESVIKTLTAPNTDTYDVNDSFVKWVSTGFTHNIRDDAIALFQLRCHRAMIKISTEIAVFDVEALHRYLSIRIRSKTQAIAVDLRYFDVPENKRSPHFHDE